MDLQLQEAIFQVINDLDPRHRLPQSELRKIANSTITQNKVTDGEWLFGQIQQSKKEFRRRRNVARIRGYAPFSSLNKRLFDKLTRRFDHRIIELMKDNLADPEDIYGNWFFRFAWTIEAIGVEQCYLNRDTLYHFVTGHSCWQDKKADCKKEFRELLDQCDA